MILKKQSTRRGLLKGLLAFGGTLIVLGLSGTGILKRSRGKDQEPATNVVKAEEAAHSTSERKFKFFDSHQGATVALIASLIIPTDKDPGADEAGVVYYIDNLVGSGEEKREAYTKGIEWIDGFSRRKFGAENSFLRLKREEQLDILNQMENRLGILDEFSQAPEDKANLIVFRIRRKLNTYLLKLSDAPDVDLAKFFRTMKYDVFDGFYSNPISWPMLNYEGPPQYSGYPDYGKCSNEANRRMR